MVTERGAARSAFGGADARGALSDERPAAGTLPCFEVRCGSAGAPSPQLK